MFSRFDAKYNLNWDDYFPHQDINDFLDEIAATYEYVDVVSIGNTYEGRDTKALQITKAGPGKPNIYIEGGDNITT